MKTIGELAVDSGGSFAIATFHGSFADAKDRGNVVTQCGGNFLGDVFLGLIEDVAAFGVADNGIIDKATKLRNGSFASESAVIAPVEILCGKLELTTVYIYYLHFFVL